MNNAKKTFSPWLTTFYGLSAIAIVLIVYRFIVGLGPVTNLSDGYPWGMWIGIDIMAGIALTAGGLIIAAVVFVFGREKYKHVFRAAILTAFLGYVLEILALMVDLGRSIEIWHSIIYWNNVSPMFLVGWCVMLYGTILALEFIPTIFEGNTTFKKLYDQFVPWLGIVILTFFIFLMSEKMIYTAIGFVLLVVLWILFRSLLTKKNIFFVLIIAGIVISVAHQSSLGLLYVIVPDKLSGPWFNSYLPLDFLITAIGVGLAMVIVESTLSSKAFGFGLPSNVIFSLSKALAWVLIIAVVVKFVTLYLENGFVFNATSKQLVYFWVEIIAGLVIPFVLLLLPSIKKSEKAIFWVSVLVVAGVVLNRANVAWVGLNIEGYPTYVPHIFEILVTLGLFSIGVLLFYHICKRFPVFDKK